MKKLLALLLFACVAIAANVTIDAPVKSVTLYSNGFAYVTRAGSATLPGGSTTLHIINFTGSALLDSISPILSSAQVYEFYRYSLTYNESKNTTEYFTLDKLLNDSVGRQISFSTGNETVSGILAWYGEGRIGISSGVGVSIYSIADLERITLPASSFSKITQVNETKNENGLAIGAIGEGTRALSVTYLAAGAQWSPYYKYYITRESGSGTGSFQGWADVSNNAGEDWKGVSLRLIVGNPHIQAYNPFSYPYNAYKEDVSYAGGALPAAAPVPSFTASQVSAYYAYTLSTPATVLSGEQKGLPLLTKEIPFKREYFWDTGNANPEKVFTLNNTGNESWAPGVASVYLNGEFLGQDSIGYTPRGTEARVSVSDLPDIKAEKVILNQTSTTPTSTSRVAYYKVRLSLNNSMGEDVTLRINDRMYSGDVVQLVSSSLPAKVMPGNVLEWNAKILKGAQLEIVYEYTVTSYYIQPYY